MSVVDLAGEGVARDDGLCDALAGRVYDGLPNDGVAATLAQWCADVDRDHPSFVLPTAELAAAAARRHTRRRTARVVGVAVAVVVICLGALSVARPPRPSTAPSGHQEVSSNRSQSSHARAQVLQSLRTVQHDLAAHRWTDAESALLQAQLHLSAVAVADGRAALSARLLVLRQRLSRTVSGRAPSGPTTSGHRHRTATHHVRVRSRPRLATSGGKAATGPTDTLTSAAEQSERAPARVRPPLRHEPAPVRSAAPRSSRPRPAPPRRTPPRFGPHPVPPVKHAPIVWPPHPVPWPSDRPPTGVKLPGIRLSQDADRDGGTHPWHVRIERHAGGWDHLAARHGTGGRHRHR